MKRVPAFGFLTVLMLAAAGGCSDDGTPADPTAVLGATTATPQEYPRVVPGRLLVKFSAGTDADARRRILSRHGAEEIDALPQIRWHAVRVPEPAIDRVRIALARHQAVERVETDALIAPASIPDDPYYGKQWHLARIGLPAAWDVTKGGSAPVAILDTGVDPEPDLAPKLLPGYNFYDDNSDTSSTASKHGTVVAAVAAAATDNALGVAGVAWQNPILPIRITDPDSYGHSWAIMKGVVYAADRGARVANLSFSIGSGTLYNDAARYLHDKGGWLVAASGNNGAFIDQADNPYILSVGATDARDLPTNFTNHGPFVDFAAPGQGLYTAIWGGLYNYVSGTSHAAPVVSGVLALLFSHDPSLTADQALAILKASAIDYGAPGRDPYYGWGRIDAGRALRLAAGIPYDSAPPSCAVASSAGGAALQGTVPLGVTAADASPVVRIELYLNRWSLLGFGSGPSYSYDWATTRFPNGVYTLTARAYDAAGNAGTSASITVTVDNPPSPSPCVITAPTDGATVEGTVSVTGTAADPQGIGRVELYCDGTLAVLGLGGSWTMTWDSTRVPDGTHTLYVQAFNASTSALSSATRIRVTVANPTIDTTGPTVSITSPAPGASVTGKVKISASAADPSGVARMDFLVDGVPVGSDSSSPYSCTWNSRSQKGRRVTVTATGYDSLGNPGSASVLVTVR